MLFDYDDSNPSSILEYAKNIIGKKFKDLLDEYNSSPCKSYQEFQNSKNGIFIVNEEAAVYSEKPKAKGELGNLIEKFYFGYPPNSDQNADFPKAGVEVKQTPIDKTKKGEYRAGERLSITNISYQEPVEEDFFKSHVWKKIKCILLIHYLRDRSIDRLAYVIKFVNLFSPPKEDLKIIINDYNLIIEKIKQGKAHELSEGDTMYLGACTKGSNAKSSMREQYYGDHTLAKKRNYCFKVSYMNYVLKNYILQNQVPCESIIKEDINMSFQEYVVSLINKHIGMTDKKLCEMYNRPYNNNKSQWYDLALRMLGIKGNHAAEFKKANIVVKTIRLEENDRNKENMSFSTFKFKDLVQEEWEESTVFNYFDKTQFLFVVYEKVDDVYVVKKAKLWHMPYYDLNYIVKSEWENYINIIKNGVVFNKVERNNGKIEVKNNLPGMKDTKIIHIRPHANQSAYILKDGFTKGNVKRDAEELPNGEWMTRQCFWLNNKYVLDQLMK